MNGMVVRILLYLLLDVFSYLLFHYSWIEPSLTLHLILTGIFLISLGFEIFYTKERLLLLLPFIFSLYNLINVYVGGIIFLEFGIGDWHEFPGDPYYVNLCALCTNIGIHCLWIGFYLVPDLKFSFLNKYKTTEVNKKYFFIAIAIALLSFLIGIKTGAYGYLKEESSSGFSAYVNYGVQIGYMCIIFLAFYEHNIKRYRVILISLLLIYFAIGIASASKTTFGLPLIYLMLSFYVKGKKINPLYFVAFIGVIIIAYGIIEPFRKLNQSGYHSIKW